MPANCTRTSTPRTKPPRSASRRSTPPTKCFKDPDKRKKYDRYGDHWEHADQFEAAGRGPSAGRWYTTSCNGGGGFNVSFEDLDDVGGLGDIFGGLFRGGRGRPGRPRVTEHTVDVSLEEAFNGTTRLLMVKDPETCSTCGGSGEVAGATCHVCHGSGMVQRERRLEVKIPAGVDNGSRVKVNQQGGEIVLVVSVRPHQRFERQGDDLYTDVEVDLADALLGGEVAVPTIKGTNVMLKIPELTQNGKSIRLKGLGMPRVNGSGSGDLYARVRVRLPESLTDEQKNALAILRNEKVEARR